MKIYKVVKKDFLDNNLMSIYSDFPVTYQVGKVTNPNIEGTKLFAFTNKEVAIKYAKQCSGGEGMVYLAEGKVSSRGVWITWRISEFQLVTLFCSNAQFSPPPDWIKNSSVVCDSIKLIKRIY